MSTIAAVATPDAVGGISVIRISGEKSLEIADKIFKNYAGKAPSQMDGYTCAYGQIINDNNEKIDDVVLTVFRNPKSYTGEDVVEVSCHGGRYITKKILRMIYKYGAEPAQGGEFTKRAFLNGKMSLTQAEAVMDIISSGGESQLRYANALKDGAVFRRINKIKEMYKDTHKEAEKHIVQSDKSRASYYEIIANKKWGDKENYDICLDCSIGNEKVVNIICNYINEKNK